MLIKKEKGLLFYTATIINGGFKNINRIHIYGEDDLEKLEYAKENLGCNDVVNINNKNIEIYGNGGMYVKNGVFEGCNYLMESFYSNVMDHTECGVEFFYDASKNNLDSIKEFLLTKYWELDNEVKLENKSNLQNKLGVVKSKYRN